MNKFSLIQFQTLLKREMLEHRNLFLLAPAFLALILFVLAVWGVNQLAPETIAEQLGFAAMLFDGLSPVQMAPFFMVVAIPFLILLYTCAILYLLNALYVDRKDLSVLFWQSMPVSNLKTVLSKVVAVSAVAPFFYLAIIFGLYLVLAMWISSLGFRYDIEIAGLGYMFLAAVVSLVLLYLSVIVTALWLLPTIGWLLLFSAFAKRTPFLWAAGVFILVGFMEDFLFGSQFLANWVQSRSNPNQYIVFSFGDVFDRLFNYDMLFGIFVGSILIYGAVLMRRFTD